MDPFRVDLPAAAPEPRMPRGFRAGAATAGIKTSGRPDLAILATDPGSRAAAVAATFTLNAVPAAPVTLSQRHLARTGGGSAVGQGRHGRASAVLATSGCANAATGEVGEADQARLAGALASAVGCPVEETLALSTGLIGTRLPVDRVVPAIAALSGALVADDDALAAVADALRTTDSRPKAATVDLPLPASDGSHVGVRVAGVAKGVGMIHPRMATMLALLVTDATAEPATLARILRPVVARTWDQTTVDGDTSTNDTVFLLASAAAGARAVDGDADGERELRRAVESVARSLARQQAADGEGASTLITCQVSGGDDDATARAVARAVVGSSLLKAAVHGRDPNWGRVLAAAGNARLADAQVLEAAGLPPDEASRRGGGPVTLDASRLEVAICGIPVFAGEPVRFDAGAARRAMEDPEVVIRVDLGAGDGRGEAFGCDLTEAYVVENSAYST